MGDLNAFYTNGVRSLYPPPPYHQPPRPPRHSFFTCLPQLASACWIIIVQLRWEIPYFYRSLCPTELSFRLFFFTMGNSLSVPQSLSDGALLCLFFLQWEITYSYCSLRLTELCICLFFLRWEIPNSYRSLRLMELCVSLFYFL